MRHDTTPDVALTPVQAHEAPALAALRVEAMRESLERIGRFDAQRARERLLAGFSPPHTRHVEVDGVRVGFVVVRPIEGGWLLDHLYVRLAWQGRAIGSAVIRQVFAEADAAGQPLRVGALKESRANDFYRRHGFVPVGQGEFDNYYLRAPAAG